MEIKELRIGNFITHYEELITVSGLGRNTIHWSNGNFSMFIGNNFKPILLTEEWLIKFGFRNYDENRWDTDAMVILKYDEGCKYLANHLYVNIFYVHQLQNIYFAITREELTLNK